MSPNVFRGAGNTPSTIKFMRSANAMFPYEGGFVNDPQDNGGATNFGITHRTLADWRGVDSVSISDVKLLTKNEALLIYKNNYWNKCRCQDLPDGVDYCVFDFAVNSGPKTAGKYLQRSLGFNKKNVDGVIGPYTLRHAHEADPVFLIQDMCHRRLAFMQTLRSWKRFGRGWTRRVKALEKTSIGFITKEV